MLVAEGHLSLSLSLSLSSLSLSTVQNVRNMLVAEGHLPLLSSRPSVNSPLVGIRHKA